MAPAAESGSAELNSNHAATRSSPSSTLLAARERPRAERDVAAPVEWLGDPGTCRLVEREGVLRLGDVLALHLPAQRAWRPGQAASPE